MWYNKVMIKRAGIIGGIVAVATLIPCAFNASAVERDTDFVVDVEKSTFLTVPSNPVTLNIIPTATGTFSMSSFDVYASTNSDNGYTLMLKTDNTYLESEYADSQGITKKIQAIPFVSGGITADMFRNSSDSNIINHWGVSIGNTTSFNPVATNGTLKQTNVSAKNDKTTINIAAKVDTDVPEGNFLTTFNFAIVANISNRPKGTEGGDPKDNSNSFDGGTLGRSYEVYYNEVLQKSIYVKDDSTPEGYHLLQDGESTGGKEVYFAMQDMSPTICNRVTKIPDHLQVMDLRDAKVYWISKLADGKCWMTQNLDYDLNPNVTLTSSDTDIKKNWTPMFGELSIYDNNRMSIASNNNQISNFWTTVPISTDTGDWYWIGNWDNNGTSTWYSSTDNQYYRNDVGSPVKFQSTPFEGNREHGHVGNYYNFAAAVATNDAYTYGLQDTFDTSICPAHWRLPKTEYDYGNYDENGNGDFANLLRVYGGETNNDKVWTAEPLYFVRAGDSSQGNDIYSAGSQGYYWLGNKHKSGNIGNSNYMYFASGYVNLASVSSWYFMMNIRCIAR